MPETLEHNGFSITIERDTDPWNPRDGDSIFIMACFHRRYALGDKNHGLRSDDFNNWDDMEAHIRKNLGAVLIQPLYLYDHSLLDMATEVKPYWFHADWDSGRVGFIYTTPERVKDFLGWKRISKARLTKLQEYLDGEVDTYAKYLRGEVFYFSVTDPQGEIVDSCGGFYDRDECISEAKEACIPS